MSGSGLSGLGHDRWCSASRIGQMQLGLHLLDQLLRTILQCGIDVRAQARIDHGDGLLDVAVFVDAQVERVRDARVRLQLFRAQV